MILEKKALYSHSHGLFVEKDFGLNRGILSTSLCNISFMLYSPHNRMEAYANLNPFLFIMSSSCSFLSQAGYK